MIGVRPNSAEGKSVAKTLFDDKDKYQFLYNSAPVGLYRSSISDGRILECNEYIAKLFGYLSREEFISKFIFSDNYVHIEEREELLAKLIKDGRLENGVAQLRRRDGQNIWIKFSAIIYPEAGYVEGVASDITKQILAEEQVRKYSQAIEQNPATIVITDTEGNIEYVNSKFTELTGYTFYEVMGQNPRILKSGEMTSEEYYTLWETLKLGNVWRGEFHNRKKNGELFWESATIAPIKDEKDKITHFLAIKEDITERKQIEATLRQSEERFAAITNSAKDSIIMLDTDGNVCLWNSAAEQLTGYLADEIMGRHFHDMVAPARYLAEHHNAFAHWQKTGLGNAVGKTLELSVLRKDGLEVPVELSLSSSVISNQQYAIGIVRDITVRKRIEDALQQSEKEFMDILHAAGDAILLIDGDTFVDGNEAAARMLGYTNRADFLMTHPSKLSPPLQPDGRSSFEKANEMMQSAVEKGFHRFEWIHRKTNGEDFPVEVSLTPVVHRGKKALHCVWRDITERRRVEETLRKSNELISLFISHSPIYAYIKSVTPTDGIVLHASDNFQQMIGIPGSKIVGKTMSELFPGEFGRKMIADDWAVVSKGSIHTFEESLNDRNYTTIKFPITQGNETLLAGYTLDITERKRAEAVLARTITRFTAMIDTVHAELYLKSRDNTYIAVNRAFANNAGLHSNQIVGKRDHEIFSPNEADKYSASDEEIMKNNIEVINKLEEIRDSNGKVKWMEYTKTPLVDMEGAVTGMVGMIRDVTALYLSRQQLAQADKLAAIGTLAAGVAHEINNPIGYINSNLNTLAKYTQKVKVFLDKNASPENEEWQEMGEIMDDFRSAISESLEGTSRVKKIVMDLKSFSRIDRAEKEFSNINEGIESTLNIVWNELKYKCKVEKQLGQLPELFCMPNQLNQVFLNLLVNAGQSIADEGIIAIKTWADQGNIFISIKDNGSGIPKENLNKIFEAFFTTKEVGKGTGLGLSLVYDIIKKHNGKIEVDSTIGVGTEFIITLPIEGGISG